MNKKSLSLSLISLLLVLSQLQVASACPPASGGVPTDPGHFIIDRATDLQSVDPAWANDERSQELIQNVYETLIFFDRDYTLGPYATGLTTQFVPRLALNLGTVTPVSIVLVLPTSGTVLTFVEKWTFQIRSGVQFHDSSSLTPADVEYSFERLMVQDRSGGPSTKLYSPLLGVNNAPNPVQEPYWNLAIDFAVQSTLTDVEFYLVSPPTQTVFRQILSNTWASVVEKSWAVAEGDFDGNWASGWASIWDTWHDPPVSFIEDAIAKLSGRDGGTGPYEYDYWTPGVSSSVLANDGAAGDPIHADPTPASTYWDGWPARVNDRPTSPLYNQRIGGYIERATWNVYTDWTTRRARFLVPDSDETDVPQANILEILGIGGVGIWHVLGETMVRCFYPLPGMLPPKDRHWEIDWMRGWYFNPLYPGDGSGEYVYHRWKAKTHLADANMDGEVNILDVSYISGHWPPSFPYNPSADINGGTGAVGPSLAGPVRGIPDGAINILDLALVNAYWDPIGILHPPSC